VKTTRGKVELADGGTLFLDEIGDLTMALQAKMLRFLQERVIERVGGHQTIEVDVRVVSATNKNLEDAIRNGTFREDLYYRLNEFSVELPPLRDRPDDAIVIANHFLEAYAADQSKPLRGFTHDALVAISSHEWPGNVRELQNRIKSAVITSRGSKVGAADLALGTDDHTSAQLTLKEARNEAEKRAIRMALLQSNDNITNAAKILDVSRPTLYDLLRQYDLKP
jgi:two-component system NtrC family response regulator